MDTLATFAANTYLCMFIVTDIRTGRETAKLFDIKVTSPTYEGWRYSVTKELKIVSGWI